MFPRALKVSVRVGLTDTNPRRQEYRVYPKGRTNPGFDMRSNLLEAHIFKVGG